MAKVCGPYSKYAFSLDGKIFNFDENDENLLKYKMSDEVAVALQEALATQVYDNNVFFGYGFWPESLEKTWEFYKEAFKNCEVIPYVYYMEEQFCNTTIPHNFVVSSAFNLDALPTSGNTYEMAFASGFDATGEITSTSCFENNANTYTGALYQGNQLNKNIISMCRLATKDNHKNIVVKPILWSLDEYNDIFGQANPLWKQFETLGQCFINTSTILSPEMSTATMKEQNPGLFSILRMETKDNSNDGEYTSSNVRSYAGTLLSNNLSANSNPFYHGESSNSGINSFVFFVKTYLPWFNDDGTIDETRTAVQYWCFNIMSILSQRFFALQGGFTRSHCKTGNFTRDSYKDNNFVGLGVQAHPRNSYDVVPQVYYVPFASYLKHNTRFFKNSKIFGTYSTFTPVGRYGDWEYGVSTQNGQSVMFTDFDKNEILDFLVNGLGLHATFNDDEFNFKPVDEWEYDFPNPDVPGAGGQIGGLTGGGVGSKDGETYDDVGAPSFATRNSYLTSTYILNELNMRHLQEAMVNDDLWTTITNMFKNNPVDGVISLIRFPINFDNITTINNEDVSILGVNIAEMSETGFVRGTKVPNDIRTGFELGHFDFPERFGTFLDFSPYTKITFFLPFIGFKQISADAVVGRRVKIHYDVDYGDGSCVCVLRISNKRTTGTDFSNIESIGFTPFAVYDGQIGQVIPLTQNNAQQKNETLVKNALSSLASVGIGAAMGGAAGAAVAGVASAGMNAATTLMDKTRHTAGGTVSNQHAYAVNNLTPYVIIEFPQVNIPAGFQKYSGYITNLYDKMSSVRGFTQFDNVKITGINCTADEENELVNLLESGVIINE